jgi:hypothetical protein
MEGISEELENVGVFFMGGTPSLTYRLRDRVDSTNSLAVRRMFSTADI